MRRACLLLVWCWPALLLAQDYPRKDVDLAQWMEQLFPFQDEDANYEDLYENLAQLLASPMDLNRASEEQLRALMILTNRQVERLLAHRKENGSLLSVYELQSVEGFDLETIMKLMPFVTVRDPLAHVDRSWVNQLFTGKSNDFILRYERTLESRRGFTEAASEASRYRGSPDKWYLRYRNHRPGDFSVGFTAEKDAGESMRWDAANHYYGFDYVSYHAQIVNKGRVKNLIIGDFQTQVGQGLTLGSAFGIGKNAESVATVRRANMGFLPYTSVFEAGYMRGAALSLRLTDKLTAHGFYSSRLRDANIETDSTESRGSATSLLLTGLHRNQPELENRHRLREQNTGAVLSFKNQKLDVGAILHQTRFGTPLLRNNNPYNGFYFEGTTNTNAGAYLNFNFASSTFFSEYSHSLGHGHAWVAGLLMNPAPKLEMALHLRSYARHFYSFYGNAFAESTGVQNEQGAYWGWKYLFSRKHILSGYVDFFEFPWLRFRVYRPAGGFETLVRYTHVFSRGTSAFVQFRQEQKDRNVSADAPTYRVAPATRRNVWFNADYQATPRWSFKSRIQLSDFTLAGKRTLGFMALQDVSLRLAKWRFSGRFALFDTDDFDNRQYTYERDAFLAFSFPFFSGRGMRHYVLAHYQLTSQVDLWLRWARTEYTDRQRIGSGNDAIDGNTRNDVKLQARLRF
ncbi:MAG: helix-hairpin-helix domain-containing protein [Cyclobacteriaceae bacterium]|jgi:hypothetical protein|nr:helix-hairpin-helix domain-containing protein [Cyclobacteriaceae bacterium]